MPIDQALKDRITEYTGKMPDAEIVQHLMESQKYADVAEKIKAAKASGMSDADILDQAMAAHVSAPTSAPTQSYLGGVKEAAGNLVQKTMPWFLDKKPASAAKGLAPSAPAQDTTVQGDFRPGRLKVGQPEPTLETPPSEATQWTMQNVVNPLPEIGQNVGALAGSTEGPVGTVAGGALGRMTGKVLQSPLQKMLLPKSDTEGAGIGETLGAGVQGATGGAEAALGMRAGAAPAETLSEAAGAAKQPFETLSKFLSRRTLRAPLTPEMENVATTVPREGLNVVGSKAPAQIAEKVNQISRQVDRYLADATAAGKQISREDMLAPARQLQATYARSADTAEYGNKLAQYIADVEAKVPEVVTPEEAQSIKKFVYDAINFDAKGANQLSQAGVQGKKAFARGARTELEEAAPEIGPLNKRIGDLLQARPYAEKASEQYSMDPMRKRLFGRVKQAGARATGAIGRGLGEAEAALAPETDIAAIGNPFSSPFSNLESTLGLKYPRLSREISPEANAETRPENLLPPPPSGGYYTSEPSGGQFRFVQPEPPMPPKQITGRNFGPANRMPETTGSTPPAEAETLNLPSQAKPKNRFGGTASIPSNVPRRTPGFKPANPMKMEDLINKIAEGRGHEITAEDKVELADALIKRIGIKIQGSPTTPKENPLGFNFGERMKE